MKLVDLPKNGKLIIQILWGERTIEFNSHVINRDAKGIFVSPYLHNGLPLNINIDLHNGIVCNVYATDPVSKQRASWNNVELASQTQGEDMVYYIQTHDFNHLSTNAERRNTERIIIHKPAKVFDFNGDHIADVIVHDISDVGISFYASNNFNPASNQITVSFYDFIDGRDFNIHAECHITRSTKKAGNILNGCRIYNANKDYLLYGFLLRSRARKPEHHYSNNTNSSAIDNSNNSSINSGLESALDDAFDGALGSDS